MDGLHPFFATLVERAQALPGLAGMTVEASRHRMAQGRAGFGPGPAVGRIEDILVTGVEPPVPVRIYAPDGPPVGLVVYLHGGGWVLGSIDDFDTYGRALASESGSVVVLPQYRLAPEHPFPAGLRDCEAVLTWAQDSRERLAPGAPLMVVGDSAGANLATVAARRLAGSVDLSLQVLYYPVTDCDFDTGSYRDFGDALNLRRTDMQWFFDQYAPRDRWPDPDVSPLRADDLSRLPPAIVVVPEFDVLRDEGLAYARRMRAQGVTVTERVVVGATHSFVRLHNLCEPARAELEQIGVDLRAARRMLT